MLAVYVACIAMVIQVAMTWQITSHRHMPTGLCAE